MTTEHTANSRNRAASLLGWLAVAAAAIAGGLFAAWILEGTSPATASDVRVEVRTVAQADTKKTAAGASASASGTGSLSGVIKLDGAVPAPKTLFKKGDQTVKDAAVCAAADMPDESLVVDSATNGVANVFVYLKKAPDGYKAPPPPKEPVVFDQMGCRFLPRALMVRVGQKVLVKSGDQIAHNTHTNPIRAAPFNQVIKPADREGVPLVYDKADNLPVIVTCDFHNWMRARHLVLDHPFMAVTDAKGKFEIKDLPPGNHEFVIYHIAGAGGYLNRTYKAEIKAGKATEVKLSFAANKFAVNDGPSPKAITVAVP